MKEQLFTPDKIRTFTGRYVDPLNMTADDLIIEDIAHALAQIPRFGGHLPIPYSVAQHCVLGATASEKEGAQISLDFLMHDGSEAYLLDLPKPIKSRLPEYEAAELHIMRLIAEKWNVDVFSKKVKALDLGLLKWEWNEIMLGPDPTKYYWSTEKAEAMFMDLFTKLTTKLKIA